jgi:hypothetical protein
MTVGHDFDGLMRSRNVPRVCVAGPFTAFLTVAVGDMME